MFAGLIVWIAATVTTYVFLYNDNDIQIDDSKDATGNIPTVGDYWFWSGNNEDALSGDTLSWQAETGFVYPTWYIEQFNKALIILQNDASVNTYIDTDTISMTGVQKISVNSVHWEVAPSITLSGTIDNDISKVYIIWSNKDGVYMVEQASINSQIRSLTLDNNKNTIKPGNNTYYVLGKIGNEYALQYTTIQTREWAKFYSTMDKVCLLDLCSDPLLPKTTQANWVILQQAQDGSVVIKVNPEISISIAKKCAWWGIELQQIKKIGDHFQKINKPCGYETSNQFSQGFFDKLGNPVADSQVKINVLWPLKFGNLRYLGPVLTMKNSSTPIIKNQQITSDTLPSMIASQMYIWPELTFELPDNIFVSYKLDKTQLKVVWPTKGTDGYIVIPKVAERMNKAIVYTVGSSDIGTHDKITPYFKKAIINTPNCSKPYTNSSDPEAKFGIFPINAEYDIVWLWNCYSVSN